MHEHIPSIPPSQRNPHQNASKPTLSFRSLTHFASMASNTARFSIEIYLIGRALLVESGSQLSDLIVYFPVLIQNVDSN